MSAHFNIVSITFEGNTFISYELPVFVALFRQIYFLFICALIGYTAAEAQSRDDDPMPDPLSAMRFSDVPRFSRDLYAF